MKTYVVPYPVLAALTLTALLCLAGFTSQAQDYSFTTNNGTITISGYLGPGGAAQIPATINGYPVTAIGDWAFLSVTNVTSIDFPNTLTDIGDHAFYSCASLSSMNLPNTLTNISSGAFMECAALTTFIIPTN